MQHFFSSAVLHPYELITEPVLQISLCPGIFAFARRHHASSSPSFIASTAQVEMSSCPQTTRCFCSPAYTPIYSSASLVHLQVPHPIALPLMAKAVGKKKPLFPTLPGSPVVPCPLGHAVHNIPCTNLLPCKTLARQRFCQWINRRIFKFIYFFLLC